MNDCAKEYAAALFMLARDNEEHKKCSDELMLVKSALCDYPEYAELLTSPAIPVSERLLSIENTFKGVLGEHVLSCLMLMCENGRLGYFCACVSEYEAMRHECENIRSARIISAVELSNDEKVRIIAKLEKAGKKTLIPTYQTDPTILGGVIIEYDDKIIDGSLRHRLHELKEVMDK